MPPIIFCNIGWMSNYQGLVEKPDKIVGGGSFVKKKKRGNEVCNFLECPDGYVYGYVETDKAGKDRKIQINNIGASGDYATGINVVWTATDPERGGRRVVGWYKNATVFRERQYFDAFPTLQHRRDKIDSYRIRALATDATRLDLWQRPYKLGRGAGWMGHTPWWVPAENSPRNIFRFVQDIRDLMNGLTVLPISSSQNNNASNSPSSAASAYIRYVAAYEARIAPRHTELQKKFADFLSKSGVKDIRPNVASVDVRYVNSDGGDVLAEVKPCDASNVRFAIRTAMGQLLDYSQRSKAKALLLIVIESKPAREDERLATCNGFGIAYPERASFKIIWPNS